MLRIAIAALDSELTFFDAIIDTGFDGFLYIPFHLNGISKLPIIDLQDIRMADGVFYSRLIANAAVYVGGESQEGPAILEPDGHEVIIGMDFLRKFERALILSPHDNIVLLPKSILGQQ
jgi:predicted aspartyl protease